MYAKKEVFAPLLGFLLSGVLGTGPAGALTIDNINDDFTINWFLAKGGSDNDGSGLAPFGTSRRKPLLPLPLFQPLP